MRTLSINIDELAFVLHRGPGLDMECFLNLDNGAIINIPTNRQFLKQILDVDVELLREDALMRMLLPGEGRYLHIPDQFSLRLFELQSGFTEKIKKSYPKIYQQLWRLIQKDGVYTDFRNILKDVPGLNERFLKYRDALYEKYAIEWLKENNITYSSTNQSGKNSG